jgi:predicted flap endonuclease-1-like 5' DNA nuclease
VPAPEPAPELEPEPEPEPEPAPAAAAAPAASGGTRPAALDAPRGGSKDDLKRIKGIGPKLEILCNTFGFYHFDQVAGWTAGEVAWVDQNLEGFKGRVTRDQWVAQAKLLAAGSDT